MNKQENRTGSSDNGEPFFIAVAKLRRPHGTEGEILTTILTDFPELLAPGRTVYLGQEYYPQEIQSFRWHQFDALISFVDHSTRSEVDEYRNWLVFIHAEDCPELPEGEYYFHEVIGLSVVTEQGDHLGVVKEVHETGANDVYIVKREHQKDLLLPAIEQVILEIDLKSGKMIVRLLPGLLDLY